LGESPQISASPSKREVGRFRIKLRPADTENVQLYTADIRAPRDRVGEILRLFEERQKRGELLLLGATLLYTDPAAANYRMEYFAEPRRAEDLHEMLRERDGVHCRHREERTQLDGPLVEMQAARQIEFRRSFLATSPSSLAHARETAFASRKEVRRKLAGGRIALLSDGSAFEARHQVAPELERDAYLSVRHAQVQATPLWLEARNEEEFIKAAIALAPNFFALRLSHLAREYALETSDRLAEMAEGPVYLAEYAETALLLAALVINAGRLHGRQLEGATVAVIGLGPAGQGLKDFLVRRGAQRVLGIDADMRMSSLFEKKDGVASSIDHVYDNADFIVICPGYRTRIEEKRLHDDQIILSFSDAIDHNLLPDGVRGRCHQTEEPHPVFVAPGLIGALQRNPKLSVTADALLPLLATLTDFDAQGALLPPPSADLFKQQFECLR